MFCVYVLAYEKEVLAAKQSGDQGMLSYFCTSCVRPLFFPFRFCRWVLPYFGIPIAGHIPSHSGRMQREEKNGFLLTPVTGLAGSMPFGFGHPVLLYPFPVRFILFFLPFHLFISNPRALFMHERIHRVVLIGDVLEANN